MHFTASVIEGWQKNMAFQFSVTNACNNKTLEDRTFQYSGTPDYETFDAKSCLTLWRLTTTLMVVPHR